MSERAISTMGVADLEAALKQLDLLEANEAWAGVFAPLLAQKLVDEKQARNNVNAPGGAAERETHLYALLLAEELSGWVKVRRENLVAALKAKRLGSEWQEK